MTGDIRLFIDGSRQGLDYKPMFKFINYTEFKRRVNSRDRIPKMNDLVVEGYILDNLVIVNATFSETIELLRSINGN